MRARLETSAAGDSGGPLPRSAPWRTAWIALLLAGACSAPPEDTTHAGHSGAGGAPPDASVGGASGASTGGIPVANSGGTASGGAPVDPGSGGRAPGTGGTAGAPGDGGPGGHPAATGGSPGGDDDGGPCTAVEAAEALEGAGHTGAPCDAVTYLTNPPSSGTHYGIWTEFRTYDAPVPEGFWVHSLEHGAVVLSYNCPEGCAVEVAAAQAMIDTLPVDPLCYPTGGTSLRRIVMTPDPHLTTRFAASAWGFTLRAACFDAVRFRAFAIAHYAHTVEDFCSAGAYRPADYPDTCGQ